MTSNKNKLLDIGMNLTRIGGWITEDYFTKMKRIDLFLKQTVNDLDALDYTLMPTIHSQNALKRFKQEYPSLEASILSSTKSNKDLAERLFTWGNILTHKASLINE